MLYNLMIGELSEGAATQIDSQQVPAAIKGQRQQLSFRNMFVQILGSKKVVMGNKNDPLFDQCSTPVPCFLSQQGSTQARLLCVAG